jgi:hypothetical protein
MSMKKIIFAIAGILILLFSYGMLSDRSLGNGYKMVYLEPGCIIVGNKNDIYGNVEKFYLTKQYIIGRISKPNKWMIERIKEKDIRENPYGYFIIDKYRHTQKNKMAENTFRSECKNHHIVNCTLEYTSGLDPVFDWHYWYIMITDMFD